MKNKKGFTLVELLVVIAIIGLLSTLAVVALSSARSKARDARRMSDIKQIQTALELYFSDNGEYPAGTGLTLGETGATMLNDSGFTDTAADPTYMGLVPHNFDTPSGIADYDYTQTNSGAGYEITFELEGTVAGLSGSITATESGLQ